MASWGMPEGLPASRPSLRRGRLSSPPACAPGSPDSVWGVAPVRSARAISTSSGRARPAATTCRAEWSRRCGPGGSGHGTRPTFCASCCGDSPPARRPGRARPPTPSQERATHLCPAPKHAPHWPRNAGQPGAPELEGAIVPARALTAAMRHSGHAASPKRPRSASPATRRCPHTCASTRWGGRASSRSPSTVSLTAASARGTPARSAQPPPPARLTCCLPIVFGVPPEGFLSRCARRDPPACTDKRSPCSALQSTTEPPLLAPSRRKLRALHARRCGRFDSDPHHSVWMGDGRDRQEHGRTGSRQEKPLS